MIERKNLGEEVSLYLADTIDAIIVAKALLNNGYRVQVGPMYSMTKGVCVKVWASKMKAVRCDK